MKRFLALAFLPALLAVLSATRESALCAAEKPNLIVILVDDMGWSDLGCYGSEIPTPHLDALARHGLRFTQFYNTARCCPTRASVLTGLYPHQAGVGHMTQDKGETFPGYRGHLNDRCVTIAEVLHGAGYFTTMTGKWHVGQEHGVTPWTRGFDRSLNAAAGGFYFPDSPRTELFLNGENVGRRGGPLPDQWYSSDLWADFGLKFIDEATAADKPFFLYLAHNAPHFPLQAPQEDIARFRGRFKAGWDALREQRYARQKELGLIDAAWPLSPRPEQVKAWAALTPQEQDRFDHIMAIYAAVMTRMDAAVGRLVEGLKQRGVLDNTVILFLSDNGGNAESGPDGRLEGQVPGDAASTVFCGQSWATLMNTPFRRYKHFTHEGGISTPLIVHWPAGIPDRMNGTLCHQPGHLVDIMATCVDLGAARYPAEFHGQSIQPMEGVSLRPAFTGQSVDRKQPLFFEHEGNRAIRDGDWKLVANGPGGPWELYNLKADRTEQQDVAAQHPDKVKELVGQWEAWARRANAVPWIWKPAYGEEVQPKDAVEKPKKKARRKPVAAG